MGLRGHLIQCANLGGWTKNRERRMFGRGSIITEGIRLHILYEICGLRGIAMYMFRVQGVYVAEQNEGVSHL